MLKLLKSGSISKKIALSTCLMAFLGSYNAPLITAAFAETQEAAVSEASTVQNIVLKGEIKLAKGDQKIAVSLRDSDVKQVLRMFADKAGLNIVFHQSVSGTITLDLVNVSLNDAFNMIMEMAELTYAIQEDTLMVASSEKAKELNFTKSNMAALPVKYLPASRLVEFLNKNIFTKGRPGLSNSEIAVANPRTNEILIFGSTGDYNVAKKVVEEMDKPIRVASYKVNHTTPKEMATLICDTWLEDKGTEGDELDENSESEIVVGGGVIACSIDSEDEDQGEMQSFKAQGLKVAYFPSQGVIKLYGGTVQQEEYLKHFIADADKKQPQAMIEMSIVELNESGSKTFNNTWNIYTRFFTGTIGGSTGIATNDATRPMIFKGPNQQAIYDVGDIDWATGQAKQGSTPAVVIQKWLFPTTITATINWVITNRDGRVLATPKVLVTSGQESVIDLTADYIKQTTTQYLDNGSMASQVQRTYTIGNDDGIKVTMTPFISPDGYVSLNIKPEYKTIKETVPNEFGDVAATLLMRRDLDLKNIRIKDGETLVIGGLIQEQEQKMTTKPPILGDIPGIGWFFRSSGTTKEKRELVIMITPHIVKDTEDLVQGQGIEAL